MVGIFYELNKKPERQAATAILLKGIVPVCDINKVDTPYGARYYSYMVPIENELLKGKHTDEIEADAQVIDLLFNGEHWSGANLKNIRLDENHQAVFFDFDQSKFDFILNKELIIRRLEYTENEHPNAIQLIEEKILALKQLLHGEAGKSWFVIALEHVGYNAQKDDVPLTYEEHKERLANGGDNGRNSFRVDNNELLTRIRKKIDVILEVLSKMR